MPEIDLETGDPQAAEEIDRSSKRRSGSSRSRKSSSGTDSGGTDTSLKGRLTDAFEQIAEMREAHEDEELATAFREGKQAMAQGLLSVTSHVPFLRAPLLIILAFVEPVFAFSKVGRILIRRLMDRRAARLAEREAEMAAQEPEEAYMP